jgi:hypothetical protein
MTANFSSLVTRHASLATRHSSLSLWICALWLLLVWIAPASAGENPLVSPVFEELGLEPNEMPEEVVAKIVDPSKLERFGLKGIDRDDRVDVMHLGGGKLKIVHPDTGNTIEVILKNP